MARSGFGFWVSLGMVVALGGSGCDPTDSATGDGGPDAALDAAGSGGLGGGVGGTDAAAGSGGAGGAPGADAAPDGPGAGVPGTVVRTLAYRQISSFTASPTGRPMISADATRIAYPVATGSGDPATPNRIFVINPDGTGVAQVDAYASRCFCRSVVVISADGKTVASTEEVQVRVVGSDGTLKGSLVTGSNEIWNIAITGNGATVFMLQRRDNGVAGGGPIERGVWAMNADGSNHRQIVGPAAIAAQVGTTVDKVFPFAGCGKSLEVSGDGSKGVVAVEVAGQGQFAFAFDGGVVRRLKGPVQLVSQVAISQDGAKVAVYSVDKGAEELMVMGIDGGGAKVLTTDPQGSCNAPISLNADGSQLLSGSIGMLYPTAGGDPLSLHTLTAGDGLAIGAPCCDVSPLFSMAGDGKRFAYLNPDAAGGPIQIGHLQIDPPTLGAGPTISGPTFSVGAIPRDRSVGAVVSCRIAPGAGAPLVRAGTALFLKGLEDRAGSWLSGNLSLRDDGMRGDTTANDGLFTTGDVSITSGTGGTVGPRVLRIKAEAKAGDGRRHATAIDVTGLEVK